MAWPRAAGGPWPGPGPSRPTDNLTRKFYSSTIQEWKCFNLLQVVHWHCQWHWQPALPVHTALTSLRLTARQVERTSTGSVYFWRHPCVRSGEVMRPLRRLRFGPDLLGKGEQTKARAQNKQLRAPPTRTPSGTLDLPCGSRCQPSPSHCLTHHGSAVRLKLLAVP